LGYKQSFDDQCLFQKNDSKGETSTICIHVDDVLHTFTKGARHLRQELVAALENEYKELKNVQLTNKNSISYLGLDIQWRELPRADGKRQKGLNLTMPKYLEECLVEANINGTVKTPATADLFNINPKSKQVGSSSSFLARLMKLMYLAKKCRYDILLPCVFLATRAKEPTEEDWAKLMRVYKYLNGTRHIPLFLSPDSLQLRAYVDASFAVHPDAKGQSGRVIGLGTIGGPVVIKSVKQSLVSRSSTESELISLADSTADVLMLKRLLNFLRVKGSKAVILQDNKSTKLMAESGRGG
jgi:hypothetical protein